MLTYSGFFDASWYVSKAGPSAAGDPVGHYLSVGWRTGLEPSERFPGAYLYPYYASAGFTGAPAITWITLNVLEFALPPTREQIEASAQEIRASGLFDPIYYASRAGIANTTLDPATHYLVVGETIGLNPSSAFDVAYYSERYPDAANGKLNLVLHYARHGKAEGRHLRPVQPTVVRNVARFDPAKENILFAVHEASRSGAPILGLNIAKRLANKYNIFIVCFGPGELKGAFEELGPEVWYQFPPHNRIEIDQSLAALLDERQYRFAIVNSVDSHWLIASCARRFIATVLLLVEFPLHHQPGALRDVFALASDIVVESPLVAENARDLYPALKLRPIHVLPQGVSELPKPQQIVAPPVETFDDLRRLRESGAAIVLGAGKVEYRKGVDIFLAVAAEVLRQDVNSRAHFVWIGRGFRPNEDLEYSMYLREQIARSNLKDRVRIIEPVQDLAPLYALTDVFLLTSRLDALPNVTIDAAIAGIPVVCFRNASGTARILEAHEETAACVVDYLDVARAGTAISTLLNDEAYRLSVGDATLAIAKATFDMDSYVASIDVVGREAAARVDQQRRDAAVLRSDTIFDEEPFADHAHNTERGSDAVARYLAMRGGRGLNTLETSSIALLQRPAPGFNPLRYAESTRMASPDTDPLAEFIRRGKPEGPWQLDVVQPGSSAFASATPALSRVLVHVHCDEPGLVSDVMSRLIVGRRKPDIVVTVGSELQLAEVRRSLAPFRYERLTLKVVPGTLPSAARTLFGLAPQIADYDLVASVTASRAADVSLEHLAGGQYLMADEIVGAFEQRGDLGLVFAGDVYAMQETSNLEPFKSLAARMSPDAFAGDVMDFPVDGMFWARAGALRPLAALLAQDDVLRALSESEARENFVLERLLVVSARVAGYRFAVTSLPGVFRLPQFT